MKSLLVLLLVAGAVQAKPFEMFLDGPCNNYDREKLNEGYYKCVYKDPVGIPTIGVGFNLQKFGAKSEIESVGADYNAVLNGTQCLSDSQIKTLFEKDMATAISCPEGWVSTWSKLSESAQSALADMAFNMGCGTLREFVTMRSRLEESPPDYKGAQSSMRGSAWCRQVGSRCDRDVDCMH